ncbi:MAG: hypothetical protein RL226_1301, partial [Bacteroidota bacterium]
MQLSIAQPTGIVVQVEHVHYGVVGSTDLTGYITYGVYVCFTNEDDFLSALYGLAQANPLIFQPDEEDLAIYTDCPCYESPFGAYLGSGINDVLIGPFPELAYDSWWTIGMSSSNDPGAVQVASTLPSTPVVTSGSVCNNIIDDGAVFTTFPQPNGFAGEDLKVQIAQITTCATELTVDICVQTFVNGSQANQDLTCPEPLVIDNPCLSNPMDITPTVTEEILCADDLAEVEFDVSGNGPVDYTLYTFTPFDTTLVGTQQSPVFTGLGEGQYFVSMIDSIGCRDTSEVFIFIAPPVLEAVITQTADNLCFGDALAEYCPVITGGTPPYQISIENPNGVLSFINDGECFSNLACVNGSGDYVIEIVDDNGCTITQDAPIYCPAELTATSTTTPILCFGECTGVINMNITGGTGLISVSADVPGFVPFSDTAPFTLNIPNLCTGIYTIELVDENSCTYTQIFNLQEPPQLVAFFTPTDVDCFGECNGSITFIADGGVPDYELIVTNAGGAELNAQALCAGTFTATVVDQNGCEYSELITINQPEEITFTLEASDLSCFGANDGEICLSNVSGGLDLLQWQITSPPTESTLLTTEPCFTGLSADVYTVSVTDGFCTVTQNNIIIDEPGELFIELTPTNISCFGLTDGMIEVSCEGGTGVVQIIEPVMEECPFTITDLVAGSYTVTIQDETGCTDSAVAEIIEPADLTISVLDTNDISCGGDCDGSAVLDFEGGTGELVLFLNDEVMLPIGLCANVYTAVIQDENGCQESVEFEIIQPDPITFLFNVDNVTCTGMNDGSVNIFPIGGVGELSWEIVEDVDINNLFEGVYNVTAVDETGCTADSTFEVLADIITDMEVTVFSSPVTCWNEGDGTATAAVTGGTPPISYQWNDPQAQITATAVGLVEEVYTVVVTDAIGCTLSYLVEVEPTVGCFFIADMLTPNGDGANDEWVIGGLEFFPSSSVQIFNRWGQLLFESKGYP